MKNYTEEEYQHGLAEAKRFHLEAEYNEAIESGDTPRQACLEWDILPQDWLDEYIESELGF